VTVQGVGAAGSAGEGRATVDPRLRPAAHEFEACLMKEFLAPLQKDELFGSDEAGDEGSGNALMSFGSEALARAISERGGFGIAAKIIDHFAARPAAQTAAQSEGRVPETGTKSPLKGCSKPPINEVKETRS